MFRLLSHAGISAAILLMASAAEANVLNLECHPVSDPASPVYLAYWVDFDNNTVTDANIDGLGIDGPQTFPAQISDMSISYQHTGWRVFIDRRTGDNTWADGYSGPGHNQHYHCEKGNLSLTAPPPTKF